MKRGRKIKPLEWVFEGKCIRCTSHKGTDSGYIKTNRNGTDILVSRQILAKRHGWFNPELEARHTCDNKWCINPDHILIGTHADNMRDRDERNLRKPPKGILNGRSKITENDVKAIRSSTESTSILQIAYGLSSVQINNIKSGRSWSHV